jgi:exodeoxyribonuclease VII large subunit
VEELTDRLTRDVQAVLTASQRRLDFLKERPALKRPLERIQRTQIYLEEKERLLLRETLRKLEKNNMRLAAAESKLSAVSPFSIMQRGYAVAMNDKGVPVTSALSAEVGQALQVRMKDGILETTVTGKKVFDGGKEETDI